MKSLLDKLKAWHRFYDEVMDMEDEDELNKLFELEKEHYGRAYVLRRIYGRMNALRTRRERREIEEQYGRRSQRR